MKYAFISNTSSIMEIECLLSFQITSKKMSARIKLSELNLSEKVVHPLMDYICPIDVAQIGLAYSWYLLKNGKLNSFVRQILITIFQILKVNILIYLIVSTYF